MPLLHLNTTAIINQAKVVQMRAGNYDVVIDLPKIGTCIVMLCDRPDGWGGTVTDVMRVDAIDYCVAKRTLTSTQIDRVQALTAEAEAKTMNELRRTGYVL